MEAALINFRLLTLFSGKNWIFCPRHMGLKRQRKNESICQPQKYNFNAEVPIKNLAVAFSAGRKPRHFLNTKFVIVIMRPQPV